MTRRRAQLVRIGVLCGALGALLVACGPSAAYRAGTQAEQTGDFYTAVQAYRAALAEDPDDDDTRASLERAETNLVGQTTANVDAALARYDYPGALDAIAPGLDLLPDDPTLRLRLDSIRTGALAYYDHQLQAGAHRDAFEGAATMAQAFPNDPETAALADRTAAAYGQVLAERARRAEAGDQLGLALACWTVEQSVVGSPEGRQRAAALREQLSEAIAFRYQARYDGLLAGRPVPVVSGGLAELTTDPSEAQLQLRATLGGARFEESYSSWIASQDYISGYQQVPNPAYQSQMNDIARQEREVLDAEHEVLRADEDAHRAMVDRDRRQGQDDYSSYFDRWDSAERRAQREREELLREREELQRRRENLTYIPPTVEEPVWAQYRYEVREYTRTARAELTVELAEPGQPPSAIPDVVTSSTTDQWHDVQPTIGLNVDPLMYPMSEADQVADLQTQAASMVSGHLQHAFETYRSGFESEGLAMRQTHPDDAADRLARAALLDPAHLGQAARSWLDEYTGLVDVGWLRGP